MTLTNNQTTAALVAAFLCLLLLGAWIDGPDDITAAQAQADWLAELEQAEAMAHAEAQHTSDPERIARRVCGSLHGERAQVLQTDTGEWVCRRATTKDRIT